MTESKDDVAQAVVSLCNAMVDANASTLVSLTADELSYGHTSGLVENKTQFVDAITGMSKRDDFKWITVSEQTITITGDCAVVRHRFQAEVYVHGEQMNPDIRVIQIWLERAGEWKILARQAYRI